MRKFARFAGFRDEGAGSTMLAAIGWIGAAVVVGFYFDFTTACLVAAVAALLYCAGTCHR